MKKPISVIFRDVNPGVVTHVATEFPDWDCAIARVFDDLPDVAIHAVVSPANCIGRMDGGVDAAYSYRFGYYLQDRLMRQIRLLHNGVLPIGKAEIIHTQNTFIPFLISAPTMNWPPHYVGDTKNTYLAFKAVLEAADKLMHNESMPYLRILMTGLGTGTGGMSATDHVQQLRQAWNEFYEVS